jgi:hypothetical protein
LSYFYFFPAPTVREQGGAALAVAGTAQAGASNVPLKIGTSVICRI